MPENNEDRLKAALLSRALGFYGEDVNEEYNVEEDGGERMVRKKITKKYYPPDLSALNILLGKEPEISGMSDGELEAERERLINELRESVRTVGSG